MRSSGVESVWTNATAAVEDERPVGAFLTLAAFAAVQVAWLGLLGYAVWLLG